MCNFKGRPWPALQFPRPLDGNSKDGNAQLLSWRICGETFSNIGGLFEGPTAKSKAAQCNAPQEGFFKAHIAHPMALCTGPTVMPALPHASMPACTF